MHQAARNLYEPRHEAAKSRPQRDATHNKETNLSQINRATSLVAKAEWPAGDNDRSLKSQRMLGTERDGKINRERIDAFVHRFCRLCGSAGTRRSDLCTLSWGHLCATFRCGAGRVDRWPFTTETHLTGARCHGATAAGTNAAANLVCQQSLEPRRTATGRCRSCARRFAARRGAICCAPTKRRRSCSGTKICAACNNRLIRP
jgi:hypothetical protein